MTEPSIDMLPSALIKASQSARLSWEDDPSGGYITKVGPNTINIHRLEDLTGLRVLNSEGNVVDWTSSDRYVENAELERLYILVERKARKSGVILTDILHRLEQPAE